MDNNLEEIYVRTKLLIGKENFLKLNKANIVILGIGGVGGFVLESIARMGVGNITIVDKDIVDISNINRQIIATTKTIGLSKVDVAKKRINEINPSINVIEKCLNITEDNIKEIITEKIDYVIDSIDDFNAKISVIKYCKVNNIKIISSMGMANKLDPLRIKIADINKTTQCKLAKKVRKKLKELNIKKLKVIYSDEETIEIDKNIITDSKLGSISFVPSVAGLVIASEVFKDLTNDQ